jgi:hypothetical protein
MITPGISLNGKQRAGLSSRRALIGMLGSQHHRILHYTLQCAGFAHLAKDASERGTVTRSQRGRVSAE